MDFAYSEKVKTLHQQVSDFMNRHIYPNVQTYRDQLAASDDPHHHAEIIDEMSVLLSPSRPHVGATKVRIVAGRAKITDGNVGIEAVVEAVRNLALKQIGVGSFACVGVGDETAHL